MPLLKIHTNVSVDADGQRGLLTDASSCVASSLGKPEQYVMVVVEAGQAVMFAGSEEPAAFIELRSIGLPQARTPELSEALCGLLQGRLGILPDRVFINFADVPRALWGWNNGTF
ncbi:MAG: hypothetical protein H6905_09765 [Hyphomicrobiales bacterium]|nr:hypothetical protein [Hyphomicrobiales bacterium]